MLHETLEASLRDLQDAIDDFRSAASTNPEQVIGRFVAALDAEPLAGFLRSALPPVDYDEWRRTGLTRKSTIGSGEMAFPHDRAPRVALQIALVRNIASDVGRFREFVMWYTPAHMNNYSYDFEKFAEMILDRIYRDIERLAETRELPPILFEALGALPASGDAVVDDLLRQAVQQFKQSVPEARKVGLDRLWDAWERLKSLEGSGDKKVTTGALLDRTAGEPKFRKLLEDEAAALTAIGNGFHIRHYEKSRAPIEDAAHVDYLFHRMFAMLHLLLFSRNS